MRSQAVRVVLLGVLALPLAATGPCLTIATESAIRGFFKALTPLLVDRLEDRLSAQDSSPGGG